MTYTVKRLEEFSDWLKDLKDGLTRQRLIKPTQQADIRRAIKLAKFLED